MSETRDYYDKKVALGIATEAQVQEMTTAMQIFNELQVIFNALQEDKIFIYDYVYYSRILHLKYASLPDIDNNNI